MDWMTKDPITTKRNTLASHQQLEKVILAIGLAFRALRIPQFPEQWQDIPAYVFKSPYSSLQYEEFGICVRDLLKGYEDT